MGPWEFESVTEPKWSHRISPLLVLWIYVHGQRNVCLHPHTAAPFQPGAQTIPAETEQWRHFGDIVFTDILGFVLSALSLPIHFHVWTPELPVQELTSAVTSLSRLNPLLLPTLWLQTNRVLGVPQGSRLFKAALFMGKRNPAHPVS